MNGASRPSTASRAGENDLARAAAGGDGEAFARLYESYEKRIYNYCLRLLGGQHDAEDATQEAFVRVMKRLPKVEGSKFEFGPYLFTAARNTSYDMIEKRKKTEPVETAAEDTEGDLFRERAEAESDPVRSAMIGAQTDSVQAANSRLPVRQREVLALREVEGMSYDEIAETMEMNSNAVAQLISRARVKLRNEVRLDVASAIRPASAECEEALPLMAMRQDRELKAAEQRAWLESHLADCESCRLAEGEMAEAGVSYRAWAPVIPAAYLFNRTLAKAAESLGHDWSGVERPHPADPARPGAAGAGGRGPRSRVMLAAGAAVLALVVIAVMATRVGDATISGDEVSGVSAPEVVEDSLPVEFKSGKSRPKQKKRGRNEKRVSAGTPSVDTPIDPATPLEAPVSGPVTGSGGGSPGQTGSSGGNGGGGGGGGSAGGGGKPDDSPPATTPPADQPPATPPVDDPPPDPPADPPVTDPPPRDPPVTPPTRPPAGGPPNPSG